MTEDKAPTATVTPIRPDVAKGLTIDWVQQAQDEYTANVSEIAKRAHVAASVMMRVRREGDGWWHADLFWDGEHVHASEHGSAQDATLAAGEAFSRGACLRWRP